MNEDTARAICEGVGDAARSVAALRGLVDGGDFLTDAALLEGVARIREQLGELDRDLFRALGSYDYTNDDATAEGDEWGLPVGTVHRSWQSAAKHWDWPLATGSIVEHLVESTDESVRPLIEHVVEVVSDCVGLTKSKAGRVTSFRNRGIWNDAFTFGDGSGRYRYSWKPPAEPDPPEDDGTPASLGG